MAYDLQAAAANLQQQVASGGITQAQADAELNRLRGLNQQEGGIDLQAAAANLQQQVASGGITQAQADAELNRLRGLNQQAAPAQPGYRAEPISAEALQQRGVPQGVAQVTSAQDLLNKNTFNQAIDANRFNEQSPFGSSGWTTDPATGQLIRTTQLNPCGS